MSKDVPLVHKLVHRESKDYILRVMRDAGFKVASLLQISRSTFYITFVRDDGEMNVKIDINAIEQSSMLYWWEKVKNLPIPKPRTIIVPFKDPGKDFQRLKEAARKIGYPIFLRTDHTSGKHYFYKTCYVPSEDELVYHVNELLEFSDMAGIIGLPVNAFVVREYIELDWRFRAFLGLPIAPEYRFLVRDGKVERYFPYWPKSAIKFFRDDGPSNWEMLLEQMYEETKGDIPLLSKYALLVAKAVEGFWSVDFAKARDGTWYLIDMARGEVSWTPEMTKEDRANAEKE